MICNPKRQTKTKVKPYHWTYFIPGCLGGGMMGSGVCNYIIQAPELRGIFAALFFGGVSLFMFGLWRMTRLHANNLSAILDETLEMMRR